MSKMPLVRVLMATYNGDRFLEEQLSSLKGQIGVEVQVHVIDDGSTDRTLEILRTWESLGLISEVVHSNRIGSSRAFFQLLGTVPADAYVALSDQDDVWHPEKLEVSLQKIAEGCPSLVFSRRRYIDEVGKILGLSPTWETKPSWRNAIVENIAYGNTQVMNREGLLLLRSLSSLGITFYDAWIYLAFSCLGELSFIDEVLIDYRLHGQNEIGIGSKRSSIRTVRSIRAFKHQCELFLERAGGGLPEEIRFGINQHLNALNQRNLIARFWRFSRSPAKRQSRLDNLLLRIIAPLSSIGQKRNKD